MGNTSIDFKNIFEHYLNTNATSISIKTLLSERNIKRIKYDPYYQRNYVWDSPKQTFFIESVILGTEVPPLILFKTGSTIEVIDGRQRFETLKRFKENDFSLKIEGLKELTFLKNKNFNKLAEIQNLDVQSIFLNSNIRVIEFEVVNSPNINDDLIDRVKKEIFRRYNTGITPLTKDELDNAKYDSDLFSDLFKNLLRKDNYFFNKLNLCFFNKEIQKDNFQKESLITKNLDFIRRYWVLPLYPISSYASGKERIEIINLLYDFYKDDCSEIDIEFNVFKENIEQIFIINDYLFTNNVQIPHNKLFLECFLWAITILRKMKNEKFILSNEILKKISEFYFNAEKENIYTSENSFHYGLIMNRYKKTAHFFQTLFDINFDVFLKSDDFKNLSENLKQTDEEVKGAIENLNNLRLRKPQSISTPIDELRSDLKNSKYIVRPSYQRQEKINELKASSIIESILLKIKLPPIFIFNRLNGVKEVVDGQQRLLAILGYLGGQYSDEDGNLHYPLLNSFKLKELKILDLNEKKFNDLEDFQKDKILDFSLDIINIEEGSNAKFDPIDLFIRLNYKPYPIKNNSFEMWNSIVNKDVISCIKETSKKFITWFYWRDVSGKPDRMENEELITTLSYIYFKKPEEIIGFYKKKASLYCRLIDKKSLGNFLVNDIENNVQDKLKFIECVSCTERLISILDTYFTKESFNSYLNVKSNPNFRRTLQDFYIIWVVMSKIEFHIIELKLKEILEDIRLILIPLKNAKAEIVDDTYFLNFNLQLKEIQTKYIN